MLVGGRRAGAARRASRGAAPALARRGRRRRGRGRGSHRHGRRRTGDVRRGRRWNPRRGWWRRGAAWSRWTSRRSRPSTRSTASPSSPCRTDCTWMPAGPWPGSRSHPSPSTHGPSEQAERAALSVPDGARILSVRPFLPLRVAAIVRQHLTDEARDAFRAIARHAQRLVRRHRRAGPLRRRQRRARAAGTGGRRRVRPTSSSPSALRRSIHSTSPGRACSPPGRPRSGGACPCIREAAIGLPSFWAGR